MNLKFFDKAKRTAAGVGDSQESLDADIVAPKLELKGKVAGITVLSKKARLVIMVFLILVVVLVVSGVYATWPGNSLEAPKAEKLDSNGEGKPEEEGKVTPANYAEYGNKLSDGLSVPVPQTSDSTAGTPMTGPQAPVPGAGKKDGNPTSGTGKTGDDLGLGPNAGSAEPLVPGGAAALAQADKNGSHPGQQQAAGLDPSSARSASANVSGWGGNGRATRSQMPTPQALVEDKLNVAKNVLENIQRAAQQGQSPGMPQADIGQDDLNRQKRKEAFLQTAQNRGDDAYHKDTRHTPLSPYMIRAGSCIPAGLDCAINTDLPGQICAKVTQNVNDSRTGNYLLIPQGTEITGTYDSQIAMGQSRILSVWNELIFPDTSHMSLQGMPGSSADGMAGFDAEVDNHYLKIIGSAGAFSLFSAGIQLSQPATNTGANAPPTMGQTMAASLGQQLGQAGTAMAQRQLQVQPTLTRKQGYRFCVRITRHLVFPGPYKPVAAR